MRKFNKDNGYATKDLLHYGLDHLACALKLLELAPRCYDSAGYLAHLGVELYFKAIMLHDLEYFIDSHKFDKLRTRENMPKSYFEISKENAKIYNLLGKFSELRYPAPNQPIDIGSEDGIKIKSLIDEIVAKFPQRLKDEYNTFTPFEVEKGGRILMTKKKDQ